MKRKTAIIILIIVTVIAALIVAYLIFFTGDSKNPDNGVVIKSPREGVSFPVSDIENDNTPNDGDTTVRFRDIPRLRQIYDEPISGFVTYNRVDEDTATTTIETAYRFVDRATGNVFETLSDSLDITRITNTTVPQTRESYFFNEGEGVVMRYIGNLGSIETFVANIVDEIVEPTESTASTTASTTESTATETPAELQTDIQKLDGIFLSSNIPYLTKSSGAGINDDEFFYTTFEGKGYIFNGNSPQNQILVLDSPIVEWSLDWFSNNILLSVAPTYLEDGVVFILNPTNGLFKKVLDDKKGLLGKENVDGTKILFSENNNKEINTVIYDKNDKDSFNLSFDTMVDKCIWSRNNDNIFYCAVPENLNTGNYPDTWYQGSVSFNDKLYKIDLDADTLIALPGIDKSFDITNLQLTEDENFILFQNKKDLTLWSLDIKE